MARISGLAAMAAWVMGISAPAAAQEAHPRRGFARYLLSGDVPVVLVGEDRAWMPSSDPGGALALCNAAGACRQIVERTTCEVPACPGSGHLVRAAGPIADVEDYPAELEDWIAETDAVGRDPVLAPLMAYRASHPDANRPPIHWITEERHGFSFELATHAMLGAVGSSGGVLGGDVSVGLRYVTEEDDSSELDDDDDDLIDSLLGDYFGLDLRVHVMQDLSEQDPDEIVAVGLAPFAWNAVGQGRLRVPTYLQTVLLEMGGIGGGGHPAAFYFGWNVPMSLMVSDRVAIDTRISLFVIDAWQPDDEADVLFEIAIGGTLR